MRVDGLLRTLAALNDAGLDAVATFVAEEKGRFGQIGGKGGRCGFFGVVDQCLDGCPCVVRRFFNFAFAPKPPPLFRMGKRI
jgi:hypothetical protein